VTSIRKKSLVLGEPFLLVILLVQCLLVGTIKYSRPGPMQIVTFAIIGRVKTIKVLF